MPEQENGDILNLLISQGGWREWRSPEARGPAEARPGLEMKKRRMAQLCSYNGITPDYTPGRH